MTVAALSTGHEIGLGLIALAFVVFALASSMLIPRFRPDFPGRSLGGFVLLTICFFIAMLFGIFWFGKESHAGNEALGVTATTPVATGPATHTGVTQTATAPQQAPTTTTGVSPAVLSQGKSIFTSAGCSTCHTLKDAGATGTVGPNLDQLKPDQARVIKQVTNGGAIMPSFKQRLSPAQIQAVAAYVAKVAGAA